MARCTSAIWKRSWRRTSWPSASTSCWCTTIIETWVSTCCRPRTPSSCTAVYKLGLAQLTQLRGPRCCSRTTRPMWTCGLDRRGTAGRNRRVSPHGDPATGRTGAGVFGEHDLGNRGTGAVLGETRSAKCCKSAPVLQRDAGPAGPLLKAVRMDRCPCPGHHRVNLHVSALLLSDSCGDVDLRLLFYKKLATAKETIRSTSCSKNVDRFGSCPRRPRTLIDVHRRAVIARPYCVVSSMPRPASSPSPSEKTRRLTPWPSSS